VGDEAKGDSSKELSNINGTEQVKWLKPCKLCDDDEEESNPIKYIRTKEGKTY
jgi:hypothetical protein